MSIYNKKYNSNTTNQYSNASNNNSNINLKHLNAFVDLNYILL